MAPSRPDKYGRGPSPASATSSSPRGGGSSSGGEGSGGGGGGGAAASVPPFHSPLPYPTSYHRPPGGGGGGGGGAFSPPGSPYPLQVPRPLPAHRHYERSGVAGHPQDHGGGQGRGAGGGRSSAPSRPIPIGLQASGHWGVMPQHSLQPPPQHMYGQSPRGEASPRILGSKPVGAGGEVAAAAAMVDGRGDERSRSIPFGHPYSGGTPQPPPLSSQVEQRQQQQKQRFATASAYNSPVYGGRAIYPWSYEPRARAPPSGMQVQYGGGADERYGDLALAHGAELQGCQPQPYSRGVHGVGHHLWLPSYPTAPSRSMQGIGHNILHYGSPGRVVSREEEEEEEGVDDGGEEEGAEGEEEEGDEEDEEEEGDDEGEEDEEEEEEEGEEIQEEDEQIAEQEEIDVSSGGAADFYQNTNSKTFRETRAAGPLPQQVKSSATAAQGDQASPESDTMRDTGARVAGTANQELPTKASKPISSGRANHQERSDSDIMVNELEKANDGFGDSDVGMSRELTEDPTDDDADIPDSHEPVGLPKHKKQRKKVKNPHSQRKQEKLSDVDEEMHDVKSSINAPRHGGKKHSFADSPPQMWSSSERLLEGPGMVHTENELANPPRSFFRRPGLKEEVLEELGKHGKSSEKIVNIVTALHRVAEHIGLNEGTYRHEAFVPLVLFSPPEGIGRHEILSFCAKLGTVSSPEDPSVSAAALESWNVTRRVFWSSLISNSNLHINKVLLKSKGEATPPNGSSKKDTLFRINWGLVGPCARALLPANQYSYIFHEFKSASSDFAHSNDLENARDLSLDIESEVLAVSSAVWKKHLQEVSELNVRMAMYRKRSIKVNSKNMVIQVGPSVAKDAYLTPYSNGGGKSVVKNNQAHEERNKGHNPSSSDQKPECQSSKKQKRDSGGESGGGPVDSQFSNLPAIQKAAISSLRRFMLKNKKPWMSMKDISKVEIDYKKYISEEFLVQHSTAAQADKEDENNRKPFLRRKAKVQKDQHVFLFKANRTWRPPGIVPSARKRETGTFSENRFLEAAKENAIQRVNKMYLDDLREHCRKYLGIEAGILRQKGITRELLVDILTRDRSPFIEMLINEEYEKNGSFKVRSWLEKRTMLNLRDIAHKFLTVPRSMIVARGITREYLIDLMMSDTLCGVPIGSRFVQSFLAENSNHNDEKTVKLTSISGEPVIITSIDSFTPSKSPGHTVVVETEPKAHSSPAEEEASPEFLPPHKSKWPDTSSMGCARAQGYQPTQKECDRKWSKATLQRRCWLAVASKGPQAHWTGLVEDLYPFEEQLSMTEPSQANAIRRSIKRTVIAGNETVGRKTPGRRPTAAVAAQAFQQFKRNRRKIVLRPSPIDGLGVFSLEAVDEGEPILEYTGEIVRLSVADIREHEYEKGGAAGDCYMFRVDKDFVVDATTKGGIARFVNHSCSPTCSASVVAAEGHRRIMLFAARPIAPGEEITYDYKFGDEWGREKLRCGCGAPSCRKSLN